ncbi:hypothetical protein BDL97_11G074400 [Sphagnum fallax]|nr:hypothetical protein BDL97_11G074400 [Sphagnum fallax]
MEMQPARREVKTWSVAQVAEHMAVFLQSPKYERIFRENLVDGELLLELDREDLMHLGIVKLRDVKSVLRWIANCYDDDEDSSDENDSIIVASLQQIPPVPHNVKAAAASAQRKPPPLHSWFDDITYERIFKGRVKKKAVENPPPGDEELLQQLLCGKRFLRKYHPEAYRVLLQNECLVRGWFKDLSDPVVSSFFDADLKHDRCAQEALRSFIHKRQPQLGALMFSVPGSSEEVVLVRWREDDIYAWVLEFCKQHCTNGGRSKRAPLREIPSSKQKKPKKQHDGLGFRAEEDEKLLDLCSNGEFNLQLWGLKKQTTTLGTELAARDRCCSLLNGLLGAEDTQSSSFFMGDKNVQLFGYGLPVEVVREQPYKVWVVKVLSLVPETSELYVPCGLQFRNHKLQVKTVLEGSVIHMPASYMSLHATQFFMPPDDYHDEFSDKPKFQSSDEEDGGQELISSSDTLVPDLSENEQGVVQDGSESLSNHGCQGVLKDTEGGIFSIELIIDPEPTNFIPKRIFADKEEITFVEIVP